MALTLEIEKTILASHTTQSDTELKLKEDIASKEELSAKQKNFFKEREDLSKQMNSLDKEVYRLNGQREKLEESIESQINYMWDEYEITLSPESFSLFQEYSLFSFPLLLCLTAGLPVLPAAPFHNAAFAQAKERKNEAAEGSEELQSEELEMDNQIKEIQTGKEDIVKELEESEKLEKNVISITYCLTFFSNSSISRRLPSRLLLFL